jgi:type III pantothenate kinase
MILAIDSGNTSSKIGVFQNGILKDTYEFRSYPDIIQLVTKLNPDRILICSVNYPMKDFTRDLPVSKLFLLDHHTSLPIRILYTTPSTLGLDRLALSAGAWTEFPEKNLLIIDAGTCITYDFVNKNGEYLGGGISPGIQMRLESLNHYTKNLPLANFTENPQLIGDSTENSIQSGVIYGTLAEIGGIIHKYQEKFRQIKVIFSGGNVKFFESKLKGRIFAIPNLVLRGLFSIFSYNERKP